MESSGSGLQMKRGEESPGTGHWVLIFDSGTWPRERSGTQAPRRFVRLRFFGHLFFARNLQKRNIPPRLIQRILTPARQYMPLDIEIVGPLAVVFALILFDQDMRPALALWPRRGQNHQIQILPVGSVKVDAVAKVDSTYL